MAVLFATAVVARSLGPDRFGWYSFAFAFVGFFAILPAFGMDAILVRELSKAPERAQQLVGAALSLRGLLTLVCTVSALLVVFAWDMDHELQGVVAIASVYIISFTLSAFIEACFRAQLDLIVPAVAKVSAKLLLVVLTIVLAAQEMHVGGFVAAAVLSDWVPLVVALTLLVFRVKPTISADYRMWGAITRESWPLAVTALLIMVYLRADQLLLSQMSSSGALGNYAAAVSLVEKMAGIAGLVLMPMLPIISRLVNESDLHRFWSVYKQAAEAVLLLLLPIALGFSLFASDIVGLFFGTQYAGAVPALRILAWAAVVANLGSVYSVAVTALGRQRILLLIALISAGLNVIANMLLIPLWSITGAAVASLLAYGIWIPLMILHGSLRKCVTSIVRATVVPGLACIMTGLVVSGITAHLAVRATIAAATYIIICGLLVYYRPAWKDGRLQVARR